MRRLLWLIIPALLLAGVYQLSRVSADWRFIVPSKPGELLYASSFEGVEDEWTEAEGVFSAQLENGLIRLAVGNAANESVFAPLRWYFTDFDFTVDTVVTAGPLNNGFGVIFRQVNADNYYYFLISSDGYYQLTRVVDGVAKDLSIWIPSEAVQQGLNVTNRLRVVGKGDQFQFYVNETPLLMCIPDNPDAKSTYNEFTGECIEGQLLETVTDSAIPDGRLGVIAITVIEPTLEEPAVVVEFDNVIVYSP